MAVGTTPTPWRSSASSTPGRRSPAAGRRSAGSRLPAVTTTRRGEPGRGAAAEPGRRAAARHRPRPGGVRRAGRRRQRQPERAARLAERRRLPAARESLGRGTGIGPRIERCSSSPAAWLAPRPRPPCSPRAARTVAETPSASRSARTRTSSCPGPAARRRARLEADPSRLRPRSGRCRAVTSRTPAARHRGPTPLHPRGSTRIVIADRPGACPNREIADELVIEPATAARHVANILAKLGFSSRYTRCLMGHPARRVQLISACICARGVGP